MIDFRKIFDELRQTDAFQKIRCDYSPLNIYCGLREASMPSIAFMTSDPPLFIESTQCIKVTQWKEKERLYWSSFDLQTTNGRAVFYALCLDLVEASKGISDEDMAMLEVKNRFIVWRKMFRNASTPMTIEAYQGLFGELYFLLFFLGKQIGYEEAIKAWSGADKTVKDYSYGEMWYEIKTLTTGAKEVKISSLAQLESDVDGKLVIVRIERMSDNYDDGHSMAEQLIEKILERINDTSIKDAFLDKVAAYGFSANMDMTKFPKFDVKEMQSYVVADDFPRLTNKDMPHDEIIQVEYSLSLSGIKKYLEHNDDNIR